MVFPTLSPLSLELLCSFFLPFFQLFLDHLEVHVYSVIIFKITNTETSKSPVLFLTSRLFFRLFCYRLLKGSNRFLYWMSKFFDSLENFPIYVYFNTYLRSVTLTTFYFSYFFQNFVGVFLSRNSYLLKVKLIDI